MCGRFSQDATWAEVWAFTQPLEWEVPAQELEPAYNIAPTQGAWVIRADGARNQASLLQWGLSPSWSKSVLINARVETAATLPAFRASWQSRRCLVPATGWFEWCPLDGAKQPFWIHPTQSRVLMFAGLWQPGKAAGDPGAFAILTTEAEGEVRTIHSRRPLLLPPPLLGRWLHGNSEEAAAIANVEPPDLRWHAVSPAVGSPRNQGAELIAPWRRKA